MNVKFSVNQRKYKISRFIVAFVCFLCLNCIKQSHGSSRLNIRAYVLSGEYLSPDKKYSVHISVGDSISSVTVYKKGYPKAALWHGKFYALRSFVWVRRRPHSFAIAANKVPSGTPFIGVWNGGSVMKTLRSVNIGHKVDLDCCYFKLISMSSDGRVLGYAYYDQRRKNKYGKKDSNVRLSNIK